MTPSYCLRLVSPVAHERLDDITRSVASVSDIDPDSLKETLGQPAGALVVRTGSLEYVTEVRIALRREDVHTEIEPIPGTATAVGRPQASGAPPIRTSRAIEATEEAKQMYSPPANRRPSPRIPNGEEAIQETPSRPLPGWLKRFLRWYWRLRPQQQYSLAGASAVVFGMMLPMGVIFGSARSFIDLEPTRSTFTFALVGTTVWAAFARRRMVARYASAIASVLVLYAVLRFNALNRNYRTGILDIGSEWIADTFLGLIQSAWSGQLFLIIGIALMLIGVFRMWDRPASG